MIYREKLRCPVSYWLIAAAFALSFVTAVGFYLGRWFALGSALVTAVGITAVLLHIGRPAIEVDGRGVAVGGSLLEWQYLGDVVARDEPGTRNRLGPDADARAFVVERPYIAGSVEIAVRDAADPHPYWLVSTRQPQQLVAAIARGRRESPEGRLHG